MKVRILTQQLDLVNFQGTNNKEKMDAKYTTSFPGSSRFSKMAADREKTLAKAGSRDL